MSSVYDVLQNYFQSQVQGRQQIRQQKASLDRALFDAQVAERRRLQQEKEKRQSERFNVVSDLLQRFPSEKVRSAITAADQSGARFPDLFGLGPTRDEAMRDKFYSAADLPGQAKVAAASGLPLNLVLQMAEQERDRISREKMNAEDNAAAAARAAASRASGAAGGPKSFEIGIRARDALIGTPWYQENAPKADAARATIEALGKGTYTEREPERKQLIDAQTFLQSFLRDSVAVDAMTKAAMLNQQGYQSGVSEEEWDEFYGN